MIRFPKKNIRDLHLALKWTVVESDGSPLGFALADGMMNTSLLGAAPNVRNNFMYDSWCWSANLYNVQQGLTPTLLPDTFASRVLLLHPKYGLAALGHACNGVDRCSLDVFYLELAQGRSVGEALRARLRDIAAHPGPADNLYVECPLFKGEREWTVRLLGDPFLNVD